MLHSLKYFMDDMMIDYSNNEDDVQSDNSDSIGFEFPYNIADDIDILSDNPNSNND
jgi:hypothetical protein